MSPVGFEPTISEGERPQTCALDRAATGTGTAVCWKNEKRSERTGQQILVFWTLVRHPPFPRRGGLWAPCLRHGWELSDSDNFFFPYHKCDVIQCPPPPFSERIQYRSALPAVPTV